MSKYTEVILAAVTKLRRHPTAEQVFLEMKKEYPLPLLVDTLMHEKGLRVEVLSTAAVWFGVTNPQDKAQGMAELRKLHDSGAYPPVLD